MPWQADPRPVSTLSLTADETPRSIAIGDRVVPYILRRARRRTIGFSVDHRGLRVGVPHRASLAEVESMIRRHGDWVAQKLDEWHSRPRLEPLKIVDGMNIPLLGELLEVRLAVGRDITSWSGQSAPVLTLFLRSPTDAVRVLEKVLREKAHLLFSERLQYFAVLLGLSAPPLTLSRARTRWGSCSLRTGIRLNWRLIHFPLAIIDYVVIHELSHLREMNHSRRFWAIVEQFCPDYRNCRKELKNLSVHGLPWE